MALIVEDGTGLLTAESYISVVDFQTRATAEGFVYTSYSDTLIEQALRRATIYLDGKYRLRFIGYRTHNRSQALEWPRQSVYYAATSSNYFSDYAGFGSSGFGSGSYHGYRGGGFISILSNELPRELLSALFQATKRELVAPNSLTPDVVVASQVHSETVGPISVTYEKAVDAVAANRPSITIIDELLAPFVFTQNRYSGTAARG